MADSIICAHHGANYSISASTTTARFVSFATGYRSGTTSVSAEGLHSSAINTAGTLSLLTIIISANTYTINKDVFVRINGADGNLTVTVPLGTTGEFQDAVNSDSVSAGDDVCLRLAPNFQLQSWNLQSISLKFSAAANLWASSDVGFGTNINHGNASTTRYVPLVGVGDLNNYFNATEANAEKVVKSAGTFSRLQTYFSTNSLTNNATILSRVNGSNGSQSLTVTAGVTGLFEDAVNSDSVISGDNVNASCTTGAGTITANMGAISCSFASSATGWDVRWATTRTATLSFTVGNNYLGFSGTTQNSTTEATMQTRLPRQCYAHKLVARIGSNPGAGSTIALRDDGSDTALTLTIPALTTGDFEDGANVANIAADSLVCYRLNAGVGSIVPRYVGVTLDTVNPEGGDVVLRPVVAC